MKVICLLLASLALFGQTKTPITHENVWLTKRVGAPVVSPDGRWAVVPVTEPAYDSARQSADLWLVPTDGSKQPLRLTNTKAPESGAAWSPDSRSLAFSTRREGDEAPQIYILPVADGGEARRLTTAATGASSPVWRPDGKAILYQTDVYDGASNEEQNARIAAEHKQRKYNAMAWDSYPIASWDKWVKDTHPHPIVQELSPSAKPIDLLGGTELAAQPGFCGNPTADGSEDLEPVWSPDGQWVVFTVSTDRDRVVVSETTTHLFRVRALGGEPEAVTSGPDSFDGPVFSPDGKALFASYSKGGVLYSLGRIARIAWPGPSKPEVLTASFDRPINGFRPSADSRTIYLIGEEYGRSQIYSMPAAGGAIKPVTTGRSGIYTGLEMPAAGADSFVIADWQSMTHPPEVMRIDLKLGERKALTSFTAAGIAGLDLPEPRDFWFTASNGKRIHSFVVLPPGFDESKKYPLLVFMHGGPHQAWSDQWFLRWNYHLLASPGYVVLMTNYTGSPGYGEKFAADINNDVLRTPAKEINEAADEAIRMYAFIDKSRQAAGGASYGGYLANWLEGNTTRYKCLFSHAGLSNNLSMWGATDGGFYWEQRYGGPVWESKGQWENQNPLRYAENFKTPMLVTHGALDLRVPLGQSLELFKLLQRKQVPSRFVMFPSENHWIQNGEDARYFFEEVFAWLKKYL